MRSFRCLEGSWVRWDFEWSSSYGLAHDAAESYLESELPYKYLCNNHSRHWNVKLQFLPFALSLCFFVLGISTQCWQITSGQMSLQIFVFVCIISSFFAFFCFAKCCNAVMNLMFVLYWITLILWIPPKGIFKLHLLFMHMQVRCKWNWVLL